MKPKLLKISISPENSFSSRFDRVPFFYNEWHFHPEIELVLIKNGTGTQFIGNDIAHFNSGDLVLVGSNLPHLWRCDEEYFSKESTLIAESLVVHFLPTLFGDHFLHLPENRLVVELFKKAKQGIKIVGETKSGIIDFMHTLLNAKGGERIILLLQILNTLALSKDLEFIAANNMEHPSSEKESERMNSVFHYLIDNFHKQISLDDIAAKANLSPNAFCRFFKSRTKKTFSQFLIEIRINHACKLLIDTEKSIGSICFECGFNNASHFNRYFKQLNGITPLEYRKRQMLKG